MPSVTLLFGLLFLAATAYAQQTVTGSVRSADGRPLAYANVLLLHAKDSSLAKGAVVNDNGSYAFEQLTPGSYLIAIRMMGYHTSYSNPFVLSATAGTRQLEPLVAAAAEKQLNEVTVTARKPIFEQQIDKLVINPSAMISAAGGTVLDVLERSPGVRVDRQNAGITLSGRQGVMVMINGKLSRLPLETLVQMLGGMNADNVEKIELITSPPAKYDAEGNAGLINIVLKRRQDEGTNGGFSLMGGWGKYEKAAGSLNVNHNQGRVNLFTNASYNYDNRWFDFLARRTQPVEGALWYNEQYSDRYIKNYNGDVRIGADVALSKQTTLSAQVQGLINDRRGTSYNSSFTRLLPVVKPFTGSASIWVEDNRWRNLGGSLGLTHQFAGQQTLSVDADYQYYSNNGPFTLDFTQFYTTNPQITPVQAVNTSKETTIDFWVLKADYARPLGKTWKLETGVKFNRSDIHNALGVEKRLDGRFILDSAMTSTDTFYENIGALYGNLSGKFGAKTDVQAGLRAEATHTNIRNVNGQLLVDRRYLNLFPSASLSHKLSPEQILNLAYSRRITRPAYTELAPSFFLTDPNTYYVGNINLKPAYTSSVRAGYQYKSRYFIWLGYSRERNTIFRHQPVVRPGRPELIHMVQNFDQVEVLSMELTLPLTVTHWWTAQNNFAGFIRTAQTQFDVAPFYQQNWIWHINSVHSLRLGNQWTGEVSILYRSLLPAGVMNLRSMTNVVLGIQKVLPNNRGRLSLTVNDVFWTNQLKWFASFPQQQVDFTATLRDAPRIIKVTYTRSLGSQTIKAARQRRAADDEKKRVSF
ncbi:outer membrane beta-barrel family protein [Nibrella viscosa]|uniref:Outer membrane beta-barrel family protein n=1 Tax=Nibrella viscosa TaxID=1084524 RepID=A0ABP8JYR5_9BACT